MEATPSTEPAWDLVWVKRGRGWWDLVLTTPAPRRRMFQILREVAGALFTRENKRWRRVR